MNNKFSRLVFYIAATFMAAMFFIADRFLKNIALSLPPLESHPILGNYFSFYFTPNNYIAFSIPFSGHILNTTIILLIIALTLYLINSIKKKTDYYEISGLVLMICGAFSNIIDRLYYSYVIDCLSLRYFTVFNLADVMISLGAIILIYKNIKKTK